ncbi:unnamed protein product [Brassica rapa]|uniref:Bidirectional sugar transporter SWEET n=1 Tax=Brassica campestris TaxID=3711 RepID=A0A8D9G802_BRACM|nr:unnamed protein product [Brassica rapa]
MHVTCFQFSVNGIVWVIYACLKFDLYILIPNGLGSISGIVQLILYATYYKTTNWNDEDDDKEKGYSNAEIELGRA